MGCPANRQNKRFLLSDWRRGSRDHPVALSLTEFWHGDPLLYAVLYAVAGHYCRMQTWGKRRHLQPHLPTEELKRRYRTEVYDVQPEPSR